MGVLQKQPTIIDPRDPYNMLRTIKMIREPLPWYYFEILRRGWVLIESKTMASRFVAAGFSYVVGTNYLFTLDGVEPCYIGPLFSPGRAVAIRRLLCEGSLESHACWQILNATASDDMTRRPATFFRLANDMSVYCRLLSECGYESDAEVCERGDDGRPTRWKVFIKDRAH